MAAPMAAPMSCATINMGTALGAMPAKESLAARAMVTAGLAKDVDEVKKYAAPIHAGTRTAARCSDLRWGSAPMTMMRPAVAMISPSHRLGVSRSLVEACHAGSENMVLARRVPKRPPAIWAGM